MLEERRDREERKERIEGAGPREILGSRCPLGRIHASLSTLSLLFVPSSLIIDRIT
jgi:hypothetical protein